MVAWIGPAIGAAASLAGGLIGQGSADKARGDAERLASENIKLQKDFAQQGIRWRVNDAKLAGIHPLAALGAQTTSFAPVSISGGGDMSLARGIEGMGQDISRAVNATRTMPEREQAMVDTMRNYQLEGLRLDNEIKRADFQSRMMRLHSMANPAMPGVGNVMPGQGNSPALPDTLRLISGGVSENATREGDMNPDVSYLNTGDGRGFPVPSKAAKELIEDDLWQQGMHFARNVLGPMWGFNWAPHRKPDAGYSTNFHPLLGYGQQKTKTLLPGASPKGSWWEPGRFRWPWQR